MQPQEAKRGMLGKIDRWTTRAAHVQEIVAPPPHAHNGEMGKPGNTDCFQTLIARVKPSQ